MKEGEGERGASDFTEEVKASLEKRSKAIKHRGATIGFDRVKEVEADGRTKTRRIDLDISYRLEGSIVRVRLIVWGDRWAWVDVRRGGKSGWDWFTTIEGRFVGANGAKDLIRSIEATLDAIYDEKPQLRIEGLWRSNLAPGPKRH